jgi:predicted dehydrogenase
VYAAVAGRERRPFPTFRDGHRGVATVDAAMRSARDGGWVEVDL